MGEESKFKTFLVVLLFTLLAVIAFGLLWFFFGSPAAPVGFGWYVFSFAAGLSMIVLPCTLPLAFVIVPLSMGKGAAKGLTMALAFGLGVAITLSMYGVLAAAFGKVAIGTLGAPLEVVKNWLYFIAGAFAFLFALGELGLVKYRMPSYTGAFPGFIQKQQDIFKALLLGLFLGNIGVGCPHPATPVILTRIAVAGDIFYGWLLFFVHAVGRILPLIFLAILGILGVNALQGLVARKDKIERATGWAMVFVAGFILVLGLFSHDWWVLSGQHTFLEELTQEERFVGIIAGRLGVAPPHEHDLPPASSTGLFGLPLGWGTWVLLFLWVLPLWWNYSKKRKAVAALPESERQVQSATLTPLFWNAVILSLLLVVVFGYYLPQRFLARAQAPRMEEMPREGMVHPGGEHGATFYHEEDQVKEGIAVNFNVAPEVPAAGKEAALNFTVLLKPGNQPVDESELEVQHEKKMHVIGVRKDLNEFRHIHPAPEISMIRGQVQPITNLWLLGHTFGEPGEYKFWSEIRYKSQNHAFGHPPVTVSGEGPIFELQKEITTSKIVEGYQVQVLYDHLHLGENHVDFAIKDFEGRRVELDNYLGEKMHLSIISEDLKHFIHTHPSEHDDAMGNHSLFTVPEALANGAEPHELATDKDHIAFTLNFPKKGFYKLFGEFRPTGANLPPDTALRAEFWVEVSEAQPRAAGPLLGSWWGRLILSVILIAILSWVVKKYISVPAIKPSATK